VIVKQSDMGIEGYIKCLFNLKLSKLLKSLGLPLVYNKVCS